MADSSTRPMPAAARSAASAFDLTAHIALLDADGVTGATGPGVSDVALTGNGRYLYALRSGAGAIAAFRVEDHGGLTPLGPAGIPAGANGIVAR